MNDGQSLNFNQLWSQVEEKAADINLIDIADNIVERCRARVSEINR